ncbi:TetR/AcrR family transcriptional regulator, partial [Streptomyces sp. SID7982]|nr:TetR/AcrR family transcriptional regulator [Streptomyces sp. SID7982]
GRTEQEWVAEVRPAFDEAARTLPPLREASSARQDAHPRQIRDDDFAYGLERVLDGLAARLEA